MLKPVVYEGKVIEGYKFDTENHVVYGKKGGVLKKLVNANGWNLLIGYKTKYVSLESLLETYGLQYDIEEDVVDLVYGGEVIEGYKINCDTGLVIGKRGKPLKMYNFGRKLFVTLVVDGVQKFIKVDRLYIETSGYYGNVIHRVTADQIPEVYEEKPTVKVDVDVDELSDTIDNLLESLKNYKI